MMRSTKLFSLGLLGFLASFALAQGAREEIEGCYRHRYRSASVRYFYGMRHGRAEEFENIDVNGEKVDMDAFYAEWLARMGQMLSCKWKGRIIDFQWLSDAEVRCRVSETFEAKMRNATYSKISNYKMEYVSEDLWLLRDGEWVQVRSRILDKREKRED